MKIKGIDTTSIVKINGITIASIVKISGVTLPAISSYSTPLVSSGLILELDAGNTSSYPGTGTAWTDLSGNSNDCTLYNSPTYISSYSGSIQFDGANDYGYTPVTIEAAANSNLQSFGAWMYGTGADHHWFGSDAAGYGAHHLIVVIDPYWGSQPSPNLVYGGSYYGGGGESNVEYDVTGIINSGGWNYVCVVKTAAYTYDVYFNGIKVMANVYRNSVSNTHLQFGTFWSGFYMPSQLSMVHSYNRALNSTEVLANYNANYSLGKDFEPIYYLNLNDVPSAVAIEMYFSKDGINYLENTQAQILEKGILYNIADVPQIVVERQYV